MSWALVFLIYSNRVLVPQYVELYPSKEMCTKELEKYTKPNWGLETKYCVPIANK